MNGRPTAGPFTSARLSLVRQAPSARVAQSTSRVSARRPRAHPATIRATMCEAQRPGRRGPAGARDTIPRRVEAPAHRARDGERVISERVPGVRSVALGFWIGAGSRDEPDARAGVSHFIEHLLFKGSSRYSAQEIAEIFDELGGELNAATSRETTVVYARIPDDRLERALDVMADMVFRPTFTDVDSEREVVLEEIAMVEDTPNDLVHDIAAEAVFGAHPLGRPVIGRADVISTRLAARARRLPPRAYGRRRSCSRRPGTYATTSSSRCSPSGSTARPPAPGSPRGKPARPNGTPGVRFQRKDTEQYHVCLSAPGISRLDERRFAGVAHGRDRRRLGVVAALPGDPREARDGVLGLQLLVAVRRRRADRRVRRDARGQPRGVPRDRGRRAHGHRAAATCARTSSRARRRT